jgi:DNA-binding LytR/AlgR family response regulator
LDKGKLIVDEIQMNCIVIDDDKLWRRVIEEFINKTEDLNLAGSFSTAVEAINYLKQQGNIDLIFLDIEMPEMSGIDFMQTLTNPPQIIIISSKGKYALDAFDYDVIDYLLKPITYARFYKAVDKAMNRVKSNLSAIGKDEIFIKKNSALVKLKYDEILFIEALENYVIFNTFNDKYTIHFTMKAVELKLPINNFLRVHRSFIVNKSSITEIEDNAIMIKTADGLKAIPIGKSYRDKLMGDINLIAK